MIEIRTLGRTTVLVDGEPLSGEAAWPKSLALIIYMAREPGPDRREEILSVLWPDREEKRARRALNQLLYTLRKTTPKLDLESVEDAIDFGREVWLDVEEFERRYEAGDLGSAIELYEGPFLSDLSVGEVEFDHWVDRERETLRRKFRKAALDLATQSKEAGRHEAAVKYCRRLIHADPLDDEAQHLLIECLYLGGDRLEALRQFESYRDLLARELEVEPLEHTLELVARIRGERPARGGRPLPEPPPRRDERHGVREEETVSTIERPAPDLGEVERAAARPEPSVAEVPAAHGTWVRWAGAAVAVVAVTIVLAVWLWPDDATQSFASSNGGIIEAEAAHIAVLPFQTHGLGTDEEGLSLGLAQLVSLNLDGLGPVQTVDHRVVAERWPGGIDSAMPGADRLSGLAGELGASSLLRGDLHLSGEEVRLVADLVGAESGRTLARVDVRGSRDDLLQLCDQLALSTFQQVWTGVALPEMSEASGGSGSLSAIKHYVQGTVSESRQQMAEAADHYRAALGEDPSFTVSLGSLVESSLEAAGMSSDQAAAWARDLSEWARRGPGGVRTAEVIAALEFAGGRPSGGYQRLLEAESAGLPAADARAWRTLVFVYGLGTDQVAAFPRPRAPAAADTVAAWVRDTWLSGAVALRRGDEARVQASARALNDLGAAGESAEIASRLATALEAEANLAGGDTLAAVVGFRRALSAPLRPEPGSSWAGLAYYRYRLARLEAARGESGTAVEILQGLAGNSLGELLLQANVRLALGEALEAAGEVEKAATAYTTAARWWERAEAPFDSLRASAQQGLARTSARE